MDDLALKLLIFGVLVFGVVTGYVIAWSRSQKTIRQIREQWERSEMTASSITVEHAITHRRLAAACEKNDRLEEKLNIIGLVLNEKEE